MIRVASDSVHVIVFFVTALLSLIVMLLLPCSYQVAPETASRFWAYERLKRALAEDADNITLQERFVAGASAGVVAQV